MQDAAGRFRELVEVTSEEICAEVRRSLLGILYRQMALEQRTSNTIQYLEAERARQKNRSYHVRGCVYLLRI
jgi:hypothetical protein